MRGVHRIFWGQNIFTEFDTWVKRKYSHNLIILGLNWQKKSSVSTIFKNSCKIWCHFVRNFLALSDSLGSSSRNMIFSWKKFESWMDLRMLSDGVSPRPSGCLGIVGLKFNLLVGRNSQLFSNHGHGCKSRLRNGPAVTGRPNFSKPFYFSHGHNQGQRFFFGLFVCSFSSGSLKI